MRVRLLALLEREELGVGELTRIVQVPQSTVSRHLKDLRVAGWLRRRSEGTNGLFRIADDLAPDVSQLWALVRDDWAGSPTAEEDLTRLQAVLDARVPDGKSYFGRMRGQWEQVRRELFGDGFLLPTLLAALPDDQVVADLGCGTGELLTLLAPHVARVIGVDREPAMLDVAFDRTADQPNIDVRRGSLEDLPIDTRTIDIAFALLVLHHIETLDRVFTELRRIIQPTGKVILLDMLAHSREEYRHAMGHVHLGFSEATIRTLAEAAGLHLASWRTLTPAPDAQGPPLFVAVLALHPSMRIHE
jgi:ubiquinone/menaquinone biosynthesis C-methylase UbiE